MRNMIKTFAINLLFVSLINADEKQSPVISGWGWLTLGQVKESEYKIIPNNVNFNEKPLIDLQAGLKFTVPVLSRTTCRIHAMSSFVIPTINISEGVENAEPLQKSFSFSLLEAAIQTNWQIFDNFALTTEFGYFPVKYNPDAMNFGEYLFRSNAYPALLISGFEITDKIRLAGLHAGFYNHTSIGNFKVDIYLNTETESYPTGDISLSGLVGYSTPKPFMDVSFGVSFYHLIPFDKKRITPAKNQKYSVRSATFVDSVTLDTTYYTFRGTKAAIRVTFDPKIFLNSNVFGKNDLKLYAESALLGVKNYPGWYDNRRERIPIMIGFNLPAFKLLDVLSAEVEYYSMPYQNSYQNIWKSNSPVPYFDSNAGADFYSDWSPKTDDDWKWSFYASKKIRNISLSGQIASDHTSRAPYLAAGKKLYTEMVPRTKDWYFMLRCGFFF